MPLLDVKDLAVHFALRTGFFRRGGGAVRAVDGVSFQIGPGETVGLVGESGCGKSTLGRAILRLTEPARGGILLDGVDLLRLTGAELRARRRDLQMVFQDPYSSLNPRMTVGQILAEPFQIHGLAKDRAERARRIGELLGQVGLDPGSAARYPHEFSGGQRQRIGIARALAVRPRLLVCDEPVSALDVSVQAQIVNLLDDLRKEFGLAMLFIAHDLAVVEHISQRILVMYLGRIVECGPAREVIGNPRHPYTQALISAVPTVEAGTGRRRIVLNGDIPSPANPPGGCPFHPRCPVAQARCGQEVPALRPVSGGGAGQLAACHFA